MGRHRHSAYHIRLNSTPHAMGSSRGVYFRYKNSPDVVLRDVHLLG